MSKTDKTAPYWVKQMFEPCFLEEVHDHRFHACDLPPRPKTGRDLEWGGSEFGNKVRPCFWWASNEFWRSRWGRCPCYMCSYDAYESITRRKRERIEGKRYCQGGWRNEY